MKTECVSKFQFGFCGVRFSKYSTIIKGNQGITE
jgi:hypothetical protein